MICTCPQFTLKVVLTDKCYAACAATTLVVSWACLTLHTYPASLRGAATQNNCMHQCNTVHIWYVTACVTDAVSRAMERQAVHCPDTSAV